MFTGSLNSYFLLFLKIDLSLLIFFPFRGEIVLGEVKFD